MITVNSTILSYNKINQVQEQIPIPSPDSYIFEDKKSAQKLMPDLYDLDRIEDDYICAQRNSTPILSSKNNLRNNYFNSVLIEKSILNNYNTNKGPFKIMQPNIYSNFEDDGIESIKDPKEIKITNEKSSNIIKQDKINEINQRESQKINDDIINNININKNIFIKSNKKEEYIHAKSGIYNQNLFIDTNSTNNNINTDTNIFNNKNKYGEKSIRSALSTVNFKNIMKKDPKRNIITINTSLYKPKKRKSHCLSINNSINNKSKNNINNNLKLEEESNKDKHSLNVLNNNNNNKINTKKNLKEELLKSFRSNSIFNLSNNSHMEQEKSTINNLSKCNNDISDINSYLIMEDNENINAIQNNLFNHATANITKKNNINMYNFKTERNSIQRNSQQNNSKLNIRFSSMSTRKFNFDCPKKLIIEEYSKDSEDNKYLYNLWNKSSSRQNTNRQMVKINFKGLKKLVMKKAGFLNILSFLDDYDLISLLKSNKSLIALINKAISDSYVTKIKDNLKKYKKIFEIIKCSLIYTKLKNSFKIDFVLNIRFINPSKSFANINPEELKPNCYQLLFFYQCYKSLEPNAKLKTKENTKNIKMYDYYTFDLYPSGYQYPDIYITKESQQYNDEYIEENLVYIQPILPFKYNDKGVINFEIYSSKNNFIIPNSVKVIMKRFDLKDYINELNINKYNNLRVCEYEDISTHWKSIEAEKNHHLFKTLKTKIKEKFESNFFIESISFVNVGFLVYKIILIAKKPGIINRDKLGIDFGINLLIKRKYENIENEIKKNNLIIERRQILELRVGDKIIIYISVKKSKSQRKK